MSPRGEVKLVGKKLMAPIIYTIRCLYHNEFPKLLNLGKTVQKPDMLRRGQFRYQKQVLRQCRATQISKKRVKTMPNNADVENKVTTMPGLSDMKNMC